ncbi:leukocyte receptor cluster member 1 homolog [Diachasmimorpha longicaudata]|uniref:leukocyte receptor cluster member 1 homolog n=1 Tax=Diachasmimorpha longicaudata TaxID=58733 RepID=UPI0030B8B494
MNILPKKRWHVRTKENIARVRRDEAEAAEQEKQRKARAQKAETEARINLLREQSRRKYDGRDTAPESTSKDPEVLEHVNFFKNIEDGNIDYSKPNAEHEAEKKEEREKYEKQIGYLTYLGQDTNEATGKKNWYDELPRRLTDAEPSKEVQEKKKSLHDPLMDVRRYLSIMGSSSSSKGTRGNCETSNKRKLEADDGSCEDGVVKKHKRHKKKSKKCKYDKREKKPDVDLQKLRAKRLLREQSEKLKTEALLAKVRGDPLPVVKEEEARHTIRQKYNSQYCPEIARQNAERTPRH